MPDLYVVPVGFTERITDHVYDKLRALDMTLSQFEGLLESGVLVEQTWPERTLRKDVYLISGNRPPLQVVVLVDLESRIWLIKTVYDRDPDKWSGDFTRRL